jgi:hypothetical protein
MDIINLATNFLDLKPYKESIKRVCVDLRG